MPISYYKRSSGTSTVIISSGTVLADNIVAALNAAGDFCAPNAENPFATQVGLNWLGGTGGYGPEVLIPTGSFLLCLDGESLAML